MRSIIATLLSVLAIWAIPSVEQKLVSAAFAAQTPSPTQQDTPEIDLPNSANLPTWLAKLSSQDPPSVSVWPLSTQLAQGCPYEEQKALCYIDGDGYCFYCKVSQPAYCPPDSSYADGSCHDTIEDAYHYCGNEYRICGNPN